MKRTIVAALLLACGVVQASEWVPIKVATTKDAEVFVDIASLQRSGAIRRVWVKYLFAPHTHREDDHDDSSRWEDHSVLRNAYNCSEGSGKLEAITIYYEDGSSFSGPPELAAKTTWDPVVPDTVNEAVMKFVCSRKPK